MIVRPTLVLDFDGTLALGRGPLQAYVAALGRQCEDPVARERLRRECLAAVVEFDAGATPHRDAYDAVRTTALGLGSSDEQLARAYLASRDELGTPAAPVIAPDGLAAFLTELSPLAHCVLVTNAPDRGIDRALRSLGILEAVAEQHHDVGKPDGLAPIIAAHLERGPVLAVGDIWEYDLAPADHLGADTALVGVREVPEARPTLRGATLSDLYEPIRHWVLTRRQSVPA